MARKKPTAQAEFVLFNVLYEDGTLTSNRRVPSSALGGLEGDEPARGIIEAQDNEIAERSGRSPLADQVHRPGRRAQRQIRRIGHGCRAGAQGATVTAAVSPDCRTCGACCSFSREWPRFTLEDDAASRPHPRRARRPASRAHEVRRRSLRRLGGRGRRLHRLRNLQHQTGCLPRVRARRRCLPDGAAAVRIVMPVSQLAASAADPPASCH